MAKSIRFPSLNTAAASDAWRAQGFLNLYLPRHGSDDTAGVQKLGKLPLKESNAKEKTLLNWLRQDPVNAPQVLLSQALCVEFREVGDPVGFALPGMPAIQAPVQQANDPMRAAAFLNFAIPGDDGEPVQIGAIPLRMSNAYEAQLIQWLKVDTEKNLAVFMKLLSIDFREGVAGAGKGFALPALAKTGT